MVKNIHKGLSPTTIRRYIRDYNNYIAGSELAKAKIVNLTPIQIEKSVGGIIDKHEMIESCASNIIGYIRQVFAYGRRSGYIKDNPCEYVDRRLLLSRCMCKPVKADSERVLTHAELTKLKEAVWDHEKRHPEYAPDYAIELATLTGMRVGEIAALRWTAIDDHYIHVDESEHRLDYPDRPSELVIGEPKNQKHRLIPLTEEMKELFSRIRLLGMSNEELFIFVRRDGERCTAHDISCAIDRRAAEANISKTSIHGVRRTVSSILRTMLPAKTVANMLGHLEQTNEEHYNYDFFEDNEKVKALSNISKMYSNVLRFPEKNKNAKAL
jgi:integrase